MQQHGVIEPPCSDNDVNKTNICITRTANGDNSSRRNESVVEDAITIKIKHA